MRSGNHFDRSFDSYFGLKSATQVFVQNYLWKYPSRPFLFMKIPRQSKVRYDTDCGRPKNLWSRFCILQEKCWKMCWNYVRIALKSAENLFIQHTPYKIQLIKRICYTRSHFDPWSPFVFVSTHGFSLPAASLSSNYVEFLLFVLCAMMSLFLCLLLFFTLLIAICLAFSCFTLFVMISKLC